MYDEEYEVWELSDSDFDKICSIDDEYWKDEWGWWRCSDGSNITAPIIKITINGNDILAWYNEDKLNYYLEYFIDEEQGYTKEKPINYYFKEEMVFDNLLTYMCDIWGVSTEKNICALAVDLAQMNSMSLGELFSKYVG